ncbi:MAG: LysE family transporter [Anaerolineaceae bacterium]|nr:LysE family transporter [Anaerolineaceae bacterium]
MDSALFLALASIHVGAVMTPGANFLRVTQNALTYSRRSGLLTVVGVATGSSLYVTAGIIGFTAVISQSPLIYNSIRVVGALYFTYMGWGLLRRQPRLTGMTVPDESAPAFNPNGAYRSGFMTAIANPASALYFLSIFTSFIPLSSTLADKTFAGLLLLTITFTWYSTVAMLFSYSRVRAFYRRAEVSMNRFFGVIWLLLAVKLLAG